MLAALAVALLLPAGLPAIPNVDPPIRLKLSHDSYERGDHARVRVKLAQDGYLLVLRRDANGHVRVLYPLEPDDSQRVRGGKDFEVRGRGDREAFAVDEASGTGTVLAVRAEDPFDFTPFLRGSRWDYRAMSDSLNGSDAESALLDLVDRMTSGRYDYDTVGYTVYAADERRHYAGWYDPWYFGPMYPCFACSPFFYGPRYGFRATFGFRFGRGWHHHR